MCALRWLRRLSPLESTYTKERSVEICVETLRALGFDLEAIPNIRLDLEDRPQKIPRACVIAADPPEVVHLITRAQGGLADYQAFLHEAGHALHYAGCDPRLPWTFRALSRDHALTEIYSYIVEAVTREPGWHALHFGSRDARRRRTPRRRSSSRRSSTAATPRSSASSSASGRASPTERGARRRLRGRCSPTRPGSATTRARYLSDMDAGFYSADYLRAWIRSAQLRTHLGGEVGEDWWRSAETGEILRGAVRRGHATVDRGHRRRASASSRSTPARSSPNSAVSGRQVRPGRLGSSRPSTGSFQRAKAGSS